MTASVLKSIESQTKFLYVRTLRFLRSLLKWTGLLDWLERRRHKSIWAHWLCSLFAVHDIDALIRLDVPWWTYGAIAEVQAFLTDRPQARVFEYGSGASTIWLAHRSETVVSVEHDPQWHALVQDRLRKSGLDAVVSHRLVPAKNEADPHFGSDKPGYEGFGFRDYALSILSEPGLFDLIVIDGRSRASCLKTAVQKLKPDGLIVFDNSRRARYRSAIAASGLGAHRCHGLAPSLPYVDETTLLTQRDHATVGKT